MRFRADRSWRPAALTGFALVVLLRVPVADAQSYLRTDDSAQETYVVDGKGTTLYRNGVKVCRFGCAPVAAPAFHPTPITEPAAPPPTIPDRSITADRYPIPPSPASPTQVYPIRPAAVSAPQAYPVQPTPVSTPQTYPVRPAPATPPQAYPVRPAAVSAPAPAQLLSQPAVPVAAAADTAPAKSNGLTKEQKALILNAGGVAAITTYGLIFWDYFQTAPKADGEGWFGRTTKYGGADKLGHLWSTYAVGHLFSYVYRWWDFDREDANLYGALSSLTVQTLMEAGDAFSADYGFSYEDQLMNMVGAGAAYVLGRYPELARKIDLRFEYRPKQFRDLTHDVLTNYDNQRYILALKLDGFDVFHDSYLSYLELQAGYYTRGYEEWNPGTPDNRRRHLYFGVGFNVSKLVQNFVDTHFFDYVQVPYTSIGVSKGLD